MCSTYPELARDSTLFDAHKYPIPFLWEKVGALGHTSIEDFDRFVVGWDTRTPHANDSGQLEAGYYEYIGPDGWYDLLVSQDPTTGTIEIRTIDGFGVLIRCEPR